jgi:hypothetical protein
MKCPYLPNGALRAGNGAGADQELVIVLRGMGIDCERSSSASTAEYNNESDRVFARHQLWWSPYYKFQ